MGDDKEELPSCEAEKKGPFAGLLDKIEHNWIEIVATALLAIATILSAFSAFQSSRWHGKAELHFNKSEEALMQSVRLSDKANEETLVDIVLVSDYMSAVNAGDLELADSYRNYGFSDSLKVASAAWQDAITKGIPGTPRNPFLMPEYKNAKRTQSEHLQDYAERQTDAASRAIKRSNGFLLLTVLFASVLFFAGISTKFQAKGIKVAVLAMGWILLAVAFAGLFF